MVRGNRRNIVTVAANSLCASSIFARKSGNREEVGPCGCVSCHYMISRTGERQGSGDNQPPDTGYAIKVSAVSGNDQTRWRLQTRRRRP